jgi:hypothetical protein
MLGTPGANYLAGELRCGALRVVAVNNKEGARRILEVEAPAVVLLEEASLAADIKERRGIAPQLDAMLTSLAAHAPVVVIGTAESRKKLTTLIAVGAADYVAGHRSCVPVALGLIQRRLRQEQNAMESALEAFERMAGRFRRSAAARIKQSADGHPGKRGTAACGNSP